VDCLVEQILWIILFFVGERVNGRLYLSLENRGLCAPAAQSHCASRSDESSRMPALPACRQGYSKVKVSLGVRRMSHLENKDFRDRMVLFKDGY